MGAKIGGMGFKRNVFISPVHSKGQKDRERDELIRKALSDSETIKELAEQLAHILKPQMVDIVERAFRRYVKGYKLDETRSEEEWKRFRKILNGML